MTHDDSIPSTDNGAFVSSIAHRKTACATHHAAACNESDSYFIYQDTVLRLTPEQREASTAIDVDLLCLACAGTGKTQTLTTRYANIIRSGNATHREILAITFTNKAAAELKSRAQRLTALPLLGATIGTFHAICRRILKENYTLTDLPGDFTVSDEDEQEHIIRNLLERLGYPIAGRKKQRDDIKPGYPPASPSEMAHRFSLWKDLDCPESTFLWHGPLGEIAHEVVPFYEAELKRLHTIDFGGLITDCNKLFTNHPDVLTEYQRAWKYVMVDEFQDTNTAQNHWLQMIAAKANLSVVGDDDQSIYGWRGASVHHMLNFPKYRPNCKIVRLTQNFRSTTNIVAAATGLIGHNQERYAKDLWSNTTSSIQNELRYHDNNFDEADDIAHEIIAAHSAGRPYSQMAVLLRAHWLGMSIERAFLHAGIPYVLQAKSKFMDRQEIKDIMAWVKCIYSSDNSHALERAIMRPKRGIGKKRLEDLRTAAKDQHLLIFATTPEGRKILGPAASDHAKAMLAIINRLSTPLYSEDNTMTLPEFVRAVIEQSGYLEFLENDEHQEDRVKNLDMLVDLAAAFNTEHILPPLVDGSTPKYRLNDMLAEWLDHLALVSDLGYGEEVDAVKIATIHASKGLEWGILFDSEFVLVDHETRARR